ncbi:AMP-binding protein [Microtetraspora sp. AC03309]|uniref:AMP-binding protein n=1 Tax=Microtetraspora sp. AC03309 TaxID=2779376 RepID=UPI001E5B0BF2|nr:AMP-binding protein [Microtetraspora sp. AC03309]MCC5576341.1 AMP-binding protein [Microtetraspora sp. AC03309]
MSPQYENVNADPVTVALEKRLQTDPGMRVFLDREPFTIEELDRQARALAGSLSEFVRPGDRIALMARNGRVALLTWWAATFCGAYLVPLNTNNRGAILTHQVADSEPALAVAEQEFAELLAESLHLAGLTVPFVVHDPDATGGSDARQGEGPRLRFDDLVAAGTPVAAHADIDPYGTSHLVYTAGTTGPSKACMVSHGYIANMARQMWENLERRPDDRLWTPMPLFHLAAIGHVTGSLQLGSEISVAKQFSVSRFWEDIRESEATMAALMGSMLPMIARAEESQASRDAYGRLRVVSGSPVTAELAQTWRERYGVERVGSGAYGMTEACLITATPPNAYRAGSAGTVTDSFEVRIVDERDNPLPTGAAGEIVCRPTRPSIMFNGYWRQPEKTLEVFRGLWFHTGDFGRFDEDGYLFFVDRGKDYIRKGGENISSYEIEAIIATHPLVREVAVHAVPSPLNEDEVKVTIVPAAGAAPDPEEMFGWIAPRVPRYARPSHIEFRDELPKNAVGRILKRELRAQGVTARTWSTDPRSYDKNPGQGSEKAAAK